MYINKVKTMSIECDSCCTTLQFDCSDDDNLRLLANKSITCPLCDNVLNGFISQATNLIYKYNSMCDELTKFTKVHDISIED